MNSMYSEIWEVKMEDTYYMEYTTRQLADLNVQHRILNAIIKEDIASDNLKLQVEDSKLYIQYKGQILEVFYTQASAMKRYRLSGFITYKRGQQSIKIDNLEHLLAILNDNFDLKISQQLTSELISSRTGFMLIYEQFDNRQQNIADSLKFSRMPQNINFCAWLQHIVEQGEVDELTVSEGLVIEGHPTHPLSKTKLPLSEADMKLYSPEFGQIIPLKLMVIHKDKAVATSMEDHEQYMLDVVLPDYKYRLKAFLESQQLNLKDYQVILVHPWQYEHVIVDTFKEWILEGYLLPTPFEVPSKATLSFRTMELVGRPFHVKLPIKVQATSAIRTVGHVTTIDGPHLSYELQQLTKAYPLLQVATEPFGLYANTEAAKAKHLSYIIRSKPHISYNGLTLVSACLVNKNPVDGNTIIDSYLEWLNYDINQSSINEFLQHYAYALITPLIAYIQDYGIALEAHMQNTVVNLGPDFQMRFIVRDLGGSRIDLDTLKTTAPQINVMNDSLLADNIVDVIAKFQHSVIQNQFAELIHHFGQYKQVNEAELFQIVSEIVNAAIDDNKPHASELRQQLFAPTIKVKALLRMRMENKVKQYITTEIDNPICEEGWK